MSLNRHLCLTKTLVTRSERSWSLTMMNQSSSSMWSLQSCQNCHMGYLVFTSTDHTYDFDCSDTRIKNWLKLEVFCLSTEICVWKLQAKCMFSIYSRIFVPYTAERLYSPFACFMWHFIFQHLSQSFFFLSQDYAIWTAPLNSPERCASFHIVKTPMNIVPSF